jgi:uncharacterized protein
MLGLRFGGGAKNAMPVSFYELSVGCYLQTVGAVVAFLGRGRRHCDDFGIDPDSLVEARIFPDMSPLRFQIVSVAHHSIGAIAAVRRGTYLSPDAPKPVRYLELENLAAETQTALKRLALDEIDALDGEKVVFQSGERPVVFTAENFVLSFALPHFHFHATTAYDILRMKGVPLGKRDYMGRLRALS